MIHMTLAELADLCNVPAPHSHAAFTGISIDTRTLTPGNVYIALKGESMDGHQFIEEAARKGAIAALVETANPATPLPQLVVQDTHQMLGHIASAWRNRFTLPLVAVTGSNGKTTLKNMIASILKAATHNDANQVLATQGNFNNHIGLPLTLCRLNEHHRFGVIEMGMNHLGEIDYLSKLTKPVVAVINNAAASHLEGVGGTVEGVAQAKGEIFSGLSEHGIAVLNRDDAFYHYWLKCIPGHATLSFGLTDAADVSATLISQTAQYQFLTLQTPLGKIDIKLPLIGKHNLLNALAATAAAIALTLDLTDIKTGLEAVQAAPGRLNQHVLANGARIIDDTYNANPFSLDAAIETLNAFNGPKILVLGDMKELGPDELALHTLAGEKAKAAHIDCLLTYGALSKATTTRFGENAQHFTDRETLINSLKSKMTENCTVLIKGSRSMHMEKVVAALIPTDSMSNTH